MRAHLLFAACAAALALLAPTPAGAQRSTEDVSELPRKVRAPANAFELTVATGYTQALGTLEPGLAMTDVARAGIGVDGSIGYRINPHYSVSFNGQYQGLQAVHDDAVRGFAWGLALQYHIVPSDRLDPWLEVGSGYRTLWLVPFGNAGTTFLHGPELVRVRAGMDLRVSPDVAISPVAGVDATMFVFRDNATFDAISNPTVSAFVYAGLQGRIDVGGARR